MYTAEEFLRTVKHETHILKHLHSKLSPEQLAFRPAESMRTTLELLRYLSYCGIATAEAMIEGGWDAYRRRVVQADGLESKDFPDALDRQVMELEDLIGKLSQEDFRREVEAPGGGKGALGATLVNHALKYLATYRMQLFLYAKISGCSELSTWNNWGGRDQPRESS